MDVPLIAGFPLGAWLSTAELGFPTVWASGMAQVRKELSLCIRGFSGLCYCELTSGPGGFLHCIQLSKEA